MVTKYQKFGDGYKAEAVKLYRESNQTIAETARNLGLKESTLANWIKKDKDNEAVAAGEAPLTCPFTGSERDTPTCAGG
jgi:transposase-like protein